MRLQHPVWLAFQLVAHAWLAVGCVRLLRAGRYEARGRLGAARRSARTGGFVAGAAAPFVLACWAWALVAHTECGAGLGVSAALLAGLSGAIALLAGLSGKPRPGGGVAAAAWAGSVTLTLVAAVLGYC